MSIAKSKYSLTLLLLVSTLLLTACGESTPTILTTPVPDTNISNTPALQNTSGETVAPVTTQIEDTTLPPGILYNTLWQTDNGGQNWNKVLVQKGTEAEPIVGYIRKLSCISLSLCYAKQGGVTVSRDGGQTWQDFSRAQDFSCTDAADCWLLDYEEGQILQTTNGGQTFLNKVKGKAFVLDKAGQEAYPKVRRNTDIESEIAFTRVISCYGQNFCLLAGTGGRFIRTRDGGQSWEWFFGPTAAINQLTCLNQTDCLAISYLPVDEANNIFVTNDGGQNWRSPSLPGATVIKDLHCPSPKTCFTIADKSSGGDDIYTSTDKGATWTTVFHYPSKSLELVSCFNENLCYAADSIGTLLKTSDGGKNWAKQTQFELKQFQRISAISCPSQQVCYLNITGQ